jgi:SAM-dependent methyltransferase
MLAEKELPALISQDTNLRLVEPHIYSVYAKPTRASYDGKVTVYDLLSGNRYYNRLMWSYWPATFTPFCSAALASSTRGWVLDVPCGSLLFTAQIYAGYTQRPVVLLDQSVGMLRAAKARLLRLCGGVPDNLLFLQGDVLQLPFNPRSFDTIISMNVLHILQDAAGLLTGLQQALADGGTLSLTSLVANTWLGSAYLKALRIAGQVAPPRDVGRVLAIFDELGMPVQHRVEGSMMFVQHKARNDE